jgi:hypothetical protein
MQEDEIDGRGAAWARQGAAARPRTLLGMALFIPVSQSFLCGRPIRGGAALIFRKEIKTTNWMFLFVRLRLNRG